MNTYAGQHWSSRLRHQLLRGCQLIPLSRGGRGTGVKTAYGARWTDIDAGSFGLICEGLFASQAPLTCDTKQLFVLGCKLTRIIPATGGWGGWGLGQDSEGSFQVKSSKLTCGSASLISSENKTKKYSLCHVSPTTPGIL